MIKKKRKIKKRESFKAIVATAVIIFLVSLFIGFITFSNWRINQKRAELMSRAEELQKEIDELSKRNEELKNGISQIQSSDYQEEKLYEQGYKKPGEEVVVVLPSKEGEKGETEKKSFWQKIREKFGF